VIAGRRGEFRSALLTAPLWMLALSAVLHLVSLITRSEAWNFCVRAAGATMPRRVLFRAAGLGSLATVVSAQLGLATRIGALRHTAPESTPRVPALLAAEVPIIAFEALLAAMFTFTLVAPLHLPFWVPMLVIAGMLGALAALRTFARTHTAGLWQGLAAVRELRGRERLAGLVIMGVLAQVARNWLVLRAVGVHPSIFDSIAVLIVTVSMSPLPVGAGAGATATVLILGSHGMAATAAGGVLLTVTGTAGALCFAAWACADHLVARSRRRQDAELAPVVAITVAPAGPHRQPLHGRRHVVPPLVEAMRSHALADECRALAVTRARG
jgi:uncharacterized membrane protein YbhN (UPF0104 family)